MKQQFKYLILFFVLFFSTGIAMAQYVTIGTGTSTTAFLMATSSQDGKSQLIFSNTELTSASPALNIGDTIYSIGWYVATVGGQTMYGANIKITESGNTVTVWSGSLAPKLTVGWNDIVLQTPYVRQGTGNLTVEFCFDNCASTTNTLVRITPTTTTNTFNYRTGNTANGCNYTVNTFTVNRPNTRFGLSPTNGTSTASTICSGNSSILTSVSSLSPTTSVTGFTYKGLYNGSYYFISTSSKTWLAADLHCRQVGGHLVHIANAAENTYVDNNVITATTWIGHYQNCNGSSFSEPSGGWQWSNGTSATYFNWNAGEPNNSGGAENHTEMYTSGKWNDEPNASTRPYVLEIEHTYLWNTGATTASITVSPTTTTTYWVDHSLGTLTQREYFTVTVNPPTVPTFAAVGPYCSGATIPALLTTSNNSIAGTWAPATVSNTATGTYTFTPTSTAAPTCATTAPLTITITPNTTPTFTAVGPYCSGVAIPALPTTSNNGITGTWAPAISNTATGTYTFTPSAGICATNETMSITIDSLTTTGSVTTSICAGDSYTWPANGQTYTTAQSGLTVVTGCNTATLNLTVTPLTTTGSVTTSICAGDSYTWPANGVIYTTAQSGVTVVTGCNTASLTITINPNILPTFTQVAPICSGVTLAPLPTTSNNSIIGTWAPTLNNAITTTYTFTPTIGLCTTPATMTIIVNPSTSNTTTLTECDSYTWLVNGASYNTSGNYTYVNGCHTEILNLSINSSTSNSTTVKSCDTYTWSVNGNTYTTSGTYTNVGTNTYGCAHTETLNLTIGYTNDIDLVITENHVSCFNGNDGSAIITPNGGTNPYTYLWSDGQITNPAISFSAGSYSCIITDAIGCQVDTFVVINQANEIFLDFIATSPICRYDESTLSIHISNALSNIYTISLLDSILKSFVIDTNGLLIPEGVPITLTPNFSGKVYIVSLTDNQGCTRNFNDDVHIEVKQLPQLSLNEDDLCVGEPSYTLNNATPTGGTYFINYVMTDYFDVENLQIGGYNIKYEYTDPVTSCYNEITEIITISDSPEAGMLFSPQPTDIDEPNILFRDNSNEEVLISEWHLGDGTIIYDSLSFWHTYADTGTYTIKYYITNIYGCTDSVINQLTINPVYSIFIPGAFTPNDDGDNDYFYPVIIGENSYNMKIYNRWGEIIYNEDNKKWDGTINDNVIPNEIYPYSISVFDFNDRLFIYSGLVNLIR